MPKKKNKKKIPPPPPPPPPPPKPKPKPPPKRGGRGRRRFKRIYLYTRNNRIPAATTSYNQSRFYQTRTSDNSVRVSGYDLIYNIEEKLIDGPFCVIPANPAYWDGTRISQIANSYAQYRPIYVRFDYFPQVSTMTNGNIITGTLWNNTAGGSNTINQTLATSNGGKIFPVYTKASLPIRLQTNLSQNLFNFQGYLDTDTNPFIFIAMSNQLNNITPGYFMVSYTYEFKNPLGEGFDFSTQVKSASEITTDDVWETTTAVLLTETTLAAIGTKLVVKIIDETVQFFLGGSRIGVLADCVFKLFRSRPKKMTKLQEDIDDLSESNELSRLAAIIDVSENGSVVTDYISFNDVLKLSDFVKLDEAITWEYNYCAGILFKLKRIGPGRYDVQASAVNDSTQNFKNQDYYVVKLRDGHLRYSLFTSTLNHSISNYLSCRDPHVNLGKQGDHISMTVQLPVSDIPQDAVLSDIALEDVTSLYGINPDEVVGGGVQTLIPYKHELHH